jgi:ferredoxin-NADP reductase
MPTPETFEIEVIGTERLAPSVQTLRFARKDGRPLVYEPGQWVNLVLPLPHGEIRRAYSIASHPDGSPQFEIAVTHVVGGPGSTFLCTLHPGHVLQAVGPQGFFTRTATDPAPSLFVATGTGVTPLRSMILAALRAGSGAPMRLLLGVRHEHDLLYRHELEELACAHPTVEVHFTLSRPEDSWPGLRGYVQNHVVELFRALERSAGAEAHVYVCGLERMVKGVRAIAKGDLALPRQRIHAERYD